jgi:hypothetical protein
MRVARVGASIIAFACAIALVAPRDRGEVGREFGHAEDRRGPPFHGRVISKDPSCSQLQGATVVRAKVAGRSAPG